MCDYSMHAIASRPAQAGETIVSTDFRGSCTRGFASAEETEVAVCLLPGTELVFEQNVRHRGRWFGSRKVPSSVAQFCKLNPENPFQHRDALAFPDGTMLLVNSLVKGQRARVLQLPVSATGSQPKRAWLTRRHPYPRNEVTLQNAAVNSVGSSRKRD
jgi:hypothetical protein